jgi:hypothetical protein
VQHGRVRGLNLVEWHCLIWVNKVTPGCPVSGKFEWATLVELGRKLVLTEWAGRKGSWVARGEKQMGRSGERKWKEKKRKERKRAHGLCGRRIEKEKGKRNKVMGQLDLWAQEGF